MVLGVDDGEPLFVNARGGRGQVVDAAMLDGVAQLSQMLWEMRALGLWDDARGESEIKTSNPVKPTSGTRRPCGIRTSTAPSAPARAATSAS